MEQLARFLEHDYRSAVRSLREGMAEMFTIQRLKLPPSLYKCLGTTKIIEVAQSGVHKRTHKITRWRIAEMVQRWLASAWLLAENHFRKVVGHKDFWALSVILGREQNPTPLKEKWHKANLPALSNLNYHRDILARIEFAFSLGTRTDQSDLPIAKN